MPAGRAARVVSVLVVAAALAACSTPDGQGASPETVISELVPATTSVVATTVEPATSTTAAPVACLDRLGVRRLAALTTWPAAYADGWELTGALVGGLGIGGVLLMQMGDLSAAALRERLDALDATSDLGVLVAADEEGGQVQRLRGLGVLPSQQDVSSTRTPGEAQDLVEGHGRVIAAAGVDVVLGPVVDVLPGSGPPPLQRSRFFAGGPDEVTGFGRAYAEGWSRAGLVPVLKHFPGHGSASADTHDALALTPSLDDLVERDLVPFRELAATGAGVMLGHLVVPGLTGDEPASRSPSAVRYVRETLGFGDALVVSDALEMAAVGMPIPDAAVAALAAGVDVVLFTDPSVTAEVIERVVVSVAAGELDPDRLRDAAGRVLAMIEARGGGCQLE